MADFHRILGVPPDAGPDEIKRAYRQLVRQHRSDLADTARTRRFYEIRQAYEVLRGKRSHLKLRGSIGTDPAVAGDTEPDAWFADEVAVDFPSATAIFERIRDAFLRNDNPPTCLQAEVKLTRDEARRGITVPFDVPIRAACSVCDGRGERWMERCHVCAGTGESLRTHTVRLTIPSGTHHGTRLRLSLSAYCVRPTIVDIHIAVR